jgi:PAS domain S-box-containing protein
MIFQETAEFYRTIVEMAQAMIVLLDLEGKVVCVNSVFEKIFGYSLPEIKGAAWPDRIFPPQTQKTVKKILRNLSRKPISEPLLTKIVDRNGKERFVEWSYRKIGQASDNVGHILAVGRDLSESVRNEKKLLEEQLKLIERNKELTCLYGMAKIVANPAISLPELIQSIVEILPPAFQYPEKASARIQLNGKSYITAGFKDSQHRLHENLVIQAEKRGSIEVVYPQESAQKGGPEVSFLAEEHHLLKTIAHQVALMIEKKLADDKKLALEEQLRHADRLAKIGQLTAGVAHELNEPLGNILGFAQLAAKNTDLPEQIAGDLEHIIQASLHAREVIKKLMLFSRQVPHRKARINLNSLIADGLSFIEPRFAKTGIDFIREFDTGLPDILADPAQLTQVLVNLVVNAVQAMPDGGTLTIKTITDGPAVTLVVQDTGIGMDEEVRKQIFLPFFTTKDVDQGTGLGLSVVHGIISSHGGKIDVHSRKGKGSRFEITFPIHAGGEQDSE